jgi:hypothetical protein
VQAQRGDRRGIGRNVQIERKRQYLPCCFSPIPVTTRTCGAQAD